MPWPGSWTGPGRCMTMPRARPTGWLLTCRSRARPSWPGCSPAAAWPPSRRTPLSTRHWGCWTPRVRAGRGPQPGGRGHGRRPPGRAGLRRGRRGWAGYAVRRVHGAAERGCRGASAPDGRSRGDPGGGDPPRRHPGRAVFRRRSALLAVLLRHAAGPRHDRRSGRRGGRLEVSRVPGVAGGLAELAFPQRERAVKPGVAAVAGGDVEGRGDPPDRVAWTGAGRVAAAFELDLGAVAGGGPDNWRRRAHGAAGLFEQGPFERAGQLRPVDRAIAAADEGAVAGGGPDNWRRRAHGAAGLFEQGPFERAGQLRPVDRAIAAADEGAVALPGQRRHPGLVVEFCLEEGL